MNRNQHAIAEMEEQARLLRKELRDHQAGMVETLRLMFQMGKNMTAQADALTRQVSELQGKVDTLVGLVTDLLTRPAPPPPPVPAGVDDTAQEQAATDALAGIEAKVDTLINQVTAGHV